MTVILLRETLKYQPQVDGLETVELRPRKVLKP